jgi:hypothetical protein
VLSDANIQRYAKSLYPISFLLILVPLMDLTLRAMPPQFGSLQWRFGTVGLLLGNFGTILLGTALVGFVAAIAGDRRMLRVIGYLAMLLAVLTIAMLVLFVLDALQMRQLANANYKRVVLLSAAGAMFAGLLGTVALIAIARGALAASRGPAEPTRRQRAASPLVVAGQGASDA